MDELTDRQKAILGLERLWWQFTGTKETAIRERLGMSTTRYFQAVNRMIDDPRVEACEPMLVRRLRRVREDRQRTRSARRLGLTGRG